MISIDTETLRELVRAASAANDAVNDAVDALNRITIHSDWGCKEKNRINEYTVANMNRIRRLQENSASFLSVLSDVASDFEVEENSISDMFSSIEAILGRTISSQPFMGNGNTPTKTLPHFDSVIYQRNPHVINKSLSSIAYSAPDLFDNIPVCGFLDTATIFENNGGVNE